MPEAYGQRQERCRPGVPVIVAMCGAMLGKNTRGGTVVAGALNLGGSIALEMTPERRPAIGILSALAPPARL